MSVALFFFYLFSAVVIASALIVISSRNPVHSVMFLILAFVNGSGLFMLAGAEFLALILVLVYVGAVAVLFLFVVMMLNVDFNELKKGVKQYKWIGMLIGIVFLVELLLVAWAFPAATGTVAAGKVTALSDTLTNTEILGTVLYTRYFVFFQMAGLILLVAMIGAIVLTLRDRQGVRRQNIPDQVARTPADVEVRQVPFRQGV
jgi:NADH-quinone oxidoreductase subunit J